MTIETKNIINGIHNAVTLEICERCIAKSFEPAMTLVCEYLNVETDSTYDLLHSYLTEKATLPIARKALASLESEKTWLHKLF
jgi:hypothetical protein